MELHYNTRRDRKLGWGALGYFVAASVLGAFFGLVIGGPLMAYVMLLAWVTAVVALLAGVVMLMGSLRPARIYMDDHTLDIRTSNVSYSGPWDDVAAIGIEDTPPVGDPPTSKEVLVLWLPDRVQMKAPRALFTAPDGSKGYNVIDLESLIETPDEVRAVLHRYAGQRFRSLYAT